MARRRYKDRKPEATYELDGHGWEVPDQTPLEVPAGFRKPETLAETVRRLTHQELSQAAGEQGFETFEDAEDFDIPDDPDDPTTPYEEWFDPVLNRGITAQEFKDNHEVYQRRYLEAQERAYREMDLSDALRRPLRDEQPPSRAASERDSKTAPELPLAPPKDPPTSK